MTSDVIKRRLAAILSTDVVGYSRLMGDDEEGTFDMLRQCRQGIDGCIAEKYPDNQAEMFRKLSEYQPIGRMGTPAEVGAMAVFLCSDEASFITGAPFPVDGGTLYVR